MLACKYRTCQDKVKGNLEVIGGAGVRAGDGKVKSEIRKKEPAIGGPSQIHKNKEASKRRGEE
jgi:hypothetical protein